jgi:flagellar hook assembly protein FlgD
LAENENKPGVNFSLSQGATISGLVGTEGDKTPLPGAHVTAILVLRPDIKRHTLADDQGNFSLSGLPSGTYAVHAEAAGYKGEFYDNAQSLQQATLISAQAPETFSGVEIYLAMASAIAGRVTDFASGDAIAKALVSIHSFPSTAKRPRFVRAVHTNDNGEYIANVPPGEYLVAAEARGYHKEFYDGVRDINAATRVEVLENQHKTGIDFLMDKLSSISGQVTAEGAGTPIAGAVVTAFPERSTTDALISLDDLHRPFSAKTGPDGNYKIENLPGGNYIVTADAEEYLREFWDNSPTLEGATAVEVPEAGAKENINFTLEKGGAISGTVFAAAETPTPLPGAIVQVWQKGSNAAIARTKTQRDGTYRIGGLPTGEYLVFAKAEGFKGVFYDDKESRDQADAVNVAAPNETGDINFNLKKIETRGATIAGVVISEVDKNPIPHALILVIPLRVAPIPISSLFTIANEFGHYRLPGLPPGKYVAVACAPRFICEFYDNASHFSKATIIGLESGTVREDIHFSLLPARHGPYRITGRVRHGRDNRGAENTLVQAIEAGTVASTAVTNADGSFTLDELPAGEYKIFATGELGAAFFGGANEQTATSVTVGNGQNVSNIEVSLPDTPTSVDESSNQIPTRFALEPNYPNPFNPETSIKYQLPARTLVILRIYNALGQEVRTLVDGLQDAGSYATQWDGKDNKGRPLSAGIYLMRLEAGEFTMTRKMAMVK